MRNYIAGALLAVLLFTIAMLVGADISRAATPEPEPQSNVEECVPIGIAGNQTVYRCEDWQFGKVVYVNNFGFLFVAEE